VNTPDPHLGKTYGNVRLSARLGQGAMGAVYQGWHERFHQEVAVKVLLNQNGKGNVKERFLREGQAAAKIQHEHVVRVMDAGETDGVAYLVMELVTGYSLGRILDEKGPLPYEAVAHIGAQICLGLAAIHAKGIIHRDIKPDNILVGADRKVKITDLGLAKQTDDPELNRLTATGMVVGTPLYVSPEAIRDPKTATVSADMYSLGATLYHLICGKAPFSATSPYEVMRSHLEQRPQPLRELRPDIPAGLAHLVEQCLSKNPKKRPSAIELANLLSAGANVKVGASRGLAALVGITTLTIISLAAGAWMTWQNLRQIKQAPAPTARIVFTTAHDDCETRINEGPWQPLSRDGVRLSAGTHNIAIRSTRLGPTQQFSQLFTVADGDNRTVAITLSEITVPTQRISVPGNGMLFINGTAYGLDPMYTTSKAGSYALARWTWTPDKNEWVSLTANIDERGQIASGALITLDQPNGAARWRTYGSSNKKIEAHHVVSWWEADRARGTAELAPPPGWLAQGERSEQPALGLSPGIISAVLEKNQPSAILPPPALALALSSDYHAPVWAAQHGRMSVVGGNAANALLILVPQTQASPPDAQKKSP
jgi:Protein kinase domain